MSFHTRHAAVFCLLIVVASLVAFLLPLHISAQSVFLAAMLIFIGYLGVSYLLPKRKSQRDG